MIAAKRHRAAFRAALAIMAATCTIAARADRTPHGEDAAEVRESPTFKLTPSFYATTNSHDATDLNLRANLGAHAAWFGYYRRGSEFEQSRAGYEYTAQLPFGQVVPSLQVASHGFSGGSLNTQIGDTVYALAGIGRTNTRDYYNLNFDPNDSVVLGAGTRLLPRSNVSLYNVRDDRLGTGQSVTHLVWRYSPDARQRWTIDLSKKRGRPAADADMVAGDALSVTWDVGDVFVRLARDRKVNFSNEDQTRFALGLRF